MKKRDKKHVKRSIIDSILSGLLALTILVNSMLIVLGLEKQETGAAVNQTAAIECEEGANKTCYIENCEGYSTCINGKWSECRLNIVCNPGSKKPCIVGGCIKGYAVCNECGTGYEGCDECKGECSPG